MKIERFLIVLLSFGLALGAISTPVLIVGLNNRVQALEQQQQMLETFQYQIKDRELAAVEVIIHPSKDVIISFGPVPGINLGKYEFHHAGYESNIYLMDRGGKVIDKVSFDDLEYVEHGDLILVWYAKNPADGKKVPYSPDQWNAPAFYWNKESGLAIAVVPILWPPTGGVIIK